MIVWLDAQLPPTLAGWLSETFGIEAHALRDLGLRDAADTEIFAAAILSHATLVSKDADFVELVSRLGPPPQLLWVTCGNASNERLRTVFSKRFLDARVLLETGTAIVELGDAF